MTPAQRAARRIIDGLDWRRTDGGRGLARDRIVIGFDELVELIEEEYLGAAFDEATAKARAKEAYHDD